MLIVLFRFSQHGLITF